MSRTAGNAAGKAGAGAKTLTGGTIDFDPGARPTNGHFFPWRWKNTRDARFISRMVDRQGVLQEKDSMRIQRRPFTDFETGETRQTRAPQWSRRQKPTHFVALKVPRQSVLFSSIAALRSDVQESFSMKEWSDAFIEPSRLHLTLSLMTITSKREFHAALRITRSAFDEWAELTKHRGFLLRFNGLGFFGNGRVAFAKMSADHDHKLLSECVHEMRRKLAKAGVDIKGNAHDNFVPHVTIAKITQMERMRQLHRRNQQQQQEEEQQQQQQQASSDEESALSVPASQQQQELVDTEGKPLSSSSSSSSSKKKKQQQAPPPVKDRRLPRSLFSHMQWDDLGGAYFDDVGLCSMKPLKQQQQKSEIVASADEESEIAAEDSEAAEAEVAVPAATAKISMSGSNGYWDQLVTKSLRN